MVAGASATKVLDVPSFLDFCEGFLDVDVVASPFLFLDLAGSEGGNSASSSEGGSIDVLAVAPFLAPPFLDFLVAGCFEVPASPFLFLHDTNIIGTLCKANAREKMDSKNFNSL